MLPKGLCWIILTVAGLTVISLISILLVNVPEWCNDKLGAGECQKYEIDDTCYCVDMNKPNGTIGLYEQAQTQCQKLDGILATPDEHQLRIWLAKKIFSMGVDNAIVGLRKLNSKWVWMKKDEQKDASDIPWRKDFAPNSEHEYGMLNVETLTKMNEEDEYHEDYINYNYRYYKDIDPNYQWNGFTTYTNNIEEDNYAKSYFICHYTTPQEAQFEATTVREADPTPDDPCACSDVIPIHLQSLEDSTTFTSPNYPRNYCSDLLCRWIVSTGEGLTVKLEWLVFSTEPNMDFVYTYDGSTEDSPMIDKCTSTSCSDQKSSSDVMQIHFHADHVTTDLGFKARVTAIDPDPCYCSAMSEISLANLGESYTIVSPNYPQSYCTGHDCRWSVSAPKGLGIRIIWDAFDIKESDSVNIYNTAMGSDQNDLQQSCTGTHCDNAISYSEGIRIRFQSDHENAIGKTFGAVLTVVENYCKEEQPEQLGEISYSDRRSADGYFQASVTATVTCPPHSLTAVNNTKHDYATCQSPNWEKILDTCIYVCDLELKPVVDFTEPINLCHYDGVEFKSIKNGQLFEDSIVPTGSTITIEQYVLNQKTTRVFTCNNHTWTPQIPICHAAGILLLGGRRTTNIPEVEATIEYLSPIENAPSRLLELELKQQRDLLLSAILPNGTVLIAGGLIFGTNDLGQDTTELLDLSTGLITPGPKMTTYRVLAAVAWFQGGLWICGGSTHTNDMALKSCEMLNLEAGRWEPEQEMKIARFGLGLVALQESQELYAIGGMTRDWWGTGVPYKSVEKYSAISQSWELVAEMKERRAAVVATQLDGIIYACSDLSCESYHPAQDKWLPIADMKDVAVALVSLDGKLHAIGETQTHFYDPQGDDDWQNGVQLLRTRRRFTAVVVPFYDNG